MKLPRPTLIVFCGWPGSGKTSTAELVQKVLNEEITDPLEPKIHLADIDLVRRTSLGLPYPHPNESRELQVKDGREMGGAYKLLLHTAEWHLGEMRPLIICATFSSRVGQRNLLDLYNRHFEERMKAEAIPCALRIVKCAPSDDSPERVEALFKGRNFGEGGYVGGVNSPERYFEVKGRYHPILLPHMTLTTWPDRPPRECAEEALRYILS
ncbi:MAG: hypothetical protein HY435_02915 [Candidatus Liptonbacteria bacterium]|nr:hypothetical protein [Candidatus Liptonbacteria bacterium]